MGVTGLIMREKLRRERGGERRVELAASLGVGEQRRGVSGFLERAAALPPPLAVALVVKRAMLAADPSDHDAVLRGWSVACACACAWLAAFASLEGARAQRLRRLGGLHLQGSTKLLSGVRENPAKCTSASCSSRISVWISLVRSRWSVFDWTIFMMTVSSHL